jgi:trimeric autotransporter adhesin
MKPIFTLILALGLTPVFCQYKFYFGNIRSHSAYSDGNKDSMTTGYKTPADDYNYARGAYHMDFLGISDHNHFTAAGNPGMRLPLYSTGRYQADTSNNDGSFVCLYGQEWGTSANGGHLIVYGVPDLIGWESGIGAWGASNNYNVFCDKGDFNSFWNIAKTYPGAFITLAEPQPGDYGDLANTVLNDIADSLIVGLSMRTGDGLSITNNYSDQPATSYEGAYLSMLARGYHVGPTFDHDDHNTTFGRTSRGRTVVLSNSLSRDSVISAYKANRFYSSDDWDTEVNFTINGQFMGSEFTSSTDVSISVSIDDFDGGAEPKDVTSQIEIYFGTPGSLVNAGILTSNTFSSTLNYTHAISGMLHNKYYYFAKITQEDGDIIWTSPIWVTIIHSVLPLELVKFAGRQQDELIKLDWTTSQETNTDRFEIERSFNGTYFEKIGNVTSRYHNTTAPTNYDFTDANAVKGMNFYRLKQFDMDGKFKYSNIIPVVFNQSIVKMIRINPNPVNDDLNITLTVSENASLQCKIYTSEGRQVKTFNAAVNAGKNTIAEKLSGLANGNYIVVIIHNNERIAETKFVKQ